MHNCPLSTAFPEILSQLGTKMNLESYSSSTPRKKYQCAFYTTFYYVMSQVIISSCLCIYYFRYILRKSKASIAQIFDLLVMHGSDLLEYLRGEG